jgi:hypothetical protein
MKYIHVVEQSQAMTRPQPWILFGDDDHVWVEAWSAPYPIPTPEHCIEIKDAALLWSHDQQAWYKIQQQLDNYDAHYTDATNKIEQVSDNTTKQALRKVASALDDVHDALRKAIRSLKGVIQQEEE